MLRLNHICFACDRQPFHEIMQFPDIARPIVPLKNCQGVGGQSVNAASSLSSCVCQETMKDWFHIVRPLLVMAECGADRRLTGSTSPVGTALP